MSDLLQRMRARRESWVEVGGRRIQVRRPTRLQAALWGGKVRLAECLVGWEGVTLADLLPGEPPDPAPFEAEAAAEWLEDKPQLYLPLMERLRELMQQGVADDEDAEKK